MLLLYYEKEYVVQSSQSTPKEVKYAQYLIYAASIIYLVVETIALLKTNNAFYVPFGPVVVCGLGLFVGRSLGYLHSGARTFVLVLASFILLLIVGSAVLQWSGIASPVSGNISGYGYVLGVLYAVISALLLYCLTRSHVREAFKKPQDTVSQPQGSLNGPEGTQDEA